MDYDRNITGLQWRKVASGWSALALLTDVLVLNTTIFDPCAIANASQYHKLTNITDNNDDLEKISPDDLAFLETAISSRKDICICISDEDNCCNGLVTMVAYLISKQFLTLSYVFGLLSSEMPDFAFKPPVWVALKKLEQKILSYTSVGALTARSAGIQKHNPQFGLYHEGVLDFSTDSISDNVGVDLKSVERDCADCADFFDSVQFTQFDEDFYRSTRRSSSRKANTEIQIWPPVTKQKLLPGDAVWQLPEELVVFVDGDDSLEVLLSSELADSLPALGCSRIRIVSSLVAALHLRIDTAICPARHSYEIQISANRALLVAADCAGLLYATQTFLQLAQLYAGTESANRRCVSIPAMAVSDRPDVDNRAVVWSQRQFMSLSVDSLAAQVRLLSRMRYSEVRLSLDLSVSAPSTPKFSLALGCLLHELGALCSRFRISLLPALVLANIDTRPTAAQMGPFRFCETIAIALTADPPSGGGIGSVSSQSYVDVCRDLLDSVAAAGFGAVMLSSSPWVRDVVDLSDLASAAGLVAKEVDLDIALPPSLFTKPLVCVQDFLQRVAAYHVQVTNANSDVAVFPAVLSDADAAAPLVFQALSSFLFAGCAWNKSAVMDAVGIGYSLSSSSAGTGMQGMQLTVPASPSKMSFDLSALKPAVTRCVVALHTDGPSSTQFLLSVLSGELVHVELQTAAVNQATDGEGEPPVSLADFARAESVLWSLFVDVNREALQNALPTRAEALLCLNVYRRILRMAKWTPAAKSRQCRGPGRTAWAADAEDVLRTVVLLHSLSRAILLSHNALGSSVSQSANNPVAAGGGGDLQNVHQKRAAVYDNVDTSKPYIAKVYPKSDSIRDLLTRVVQQNILFRNYKAEEHASIVEAFDCVCAAAGEVVIQQGDPGECFYIIESGSVDVFMECSGLKIKIGQTLARGNYFGELALMYNTPRAATVISTEESVLWRIDRQTYRTIVTHHNKLTSAEFISLISDVTIRGKRLGDVLSGNELNKVVASLELEEFEDRSVIVRQHLTGDYFYVILEGQVDVWQETAAEQPVLMGRKVATLSRGNYFGEKALLADDVRQASCVAVGKVVCLSLSREDFIAMLGSWQDLETATDGVPAGLKRTSRPHLSSADSALQVPISSLADLRMVSTLGVGAFGKVKLAKHRTTGRAFAVKFQSKAFVERQGMQAMIQSEARIMKGLNHPCIARLYAALQDRLYVYFVLELLPGGEFFSYLQQAGKLSEDKARFYSAAVVCAFEELHSSKIAYRDLKPENMVLDGRGYVKLVDFGLAKQIPSGSTWTMCGTPDYLAPELVLNKGHDLAVDYWALGVLIFEMISGWPPFFHDSNPMKVYEKIISGKVNYPDSFSKPLEDLVGKLLAKNPSKRLGNMKGGIADVTKHKWFGSFDWKGLVSGTIVPHYVPDLTGFNRRLRDDESEDSDEEDEEDDDDKEESDWVADFS